MKIRVITSIVAIVLFALILLAPPIVFSAALAAVILMMLYECYKATKADWAMKTIGLISAAMVMVGVYRVVHAPVYAFTTLNVVIVSIIMLYMVLTIAEHGKKGYTEVMSSGFLTLYITISMCCSWLAKEIFGTEYMLLIFICAWATDTSAYFAGKFLGRHKLIPRVSPNKTVEGSIGGVLGAVIICTVYLFIAGILIDIAINKLLLGVIVGLIGGVCSQFGDLVASAIKRDTGIKDFGSIFPGHGGIMDRFDSVIFVAPIVFGILIITFIFTNSSVMLY